MSPPGNDYLEGCATTEKVTRGGVAEGGMAHREALDVKSRHVADLGYMLRQRPVLWANLMGYTNGGAALCPITESDRSRPASA